jgi:cyanophycinase
MAPVFLHGGGSHPEGDIAALAPFVATAAALGGPIAVVLVAEVAADWDAYRAMLERAGAGELTRLVVAPDEPLTAARLAGHHPGGVFVCGGPTPRYQEALCTDHSWLDYLRARALPYGGTSAGAAIAAERAIVGGWRVGRAAGAVPILFQGASEGLDLLESRPGLGLVPWAVEGHASQAGTLTRLLHALDAGVADAGWAIDEHTALSVRGERTEVHGLGQAYYARRLPADGVQVRIVPAGTTVTIDRSAT